MKEVPEPATLMLVMFRVLRAAVLAQPPVSEIEEVVSLVHGSFWVSGLRGSSLRNAGGKNDFTFGIIWNLRFVSRAFRCEWVFGS